MTMKKFDFETELADTKIAAYKTKAIADAFAHEYIESNNYHVTAAEIEASPDSFVYLFTAMHDALCEVCKKLDELESAKVEG